jgi:hypothetical protein
MFSDCIDRDGQVRRSLRTHRSRRFNGSDPTIDRFVGTCTSANIEHGPGACELPPDHRDNARIRPAVLSISLADESVIRVRSAAIVMSGTHVQSPKLGSPLTGTYIMQPDLSDFGGVSRPRPSKSRYTYCKKTECGIALYSLSYSVSEKSVSDLSVVHQNQRSATSTLLLRGRDVPPPLVVTDAKGRRSKLWDMAPSLRCSIIGTCLSAAELRQFFVKIGEVSAKTASDHTLHSFGVNAAGKHDLIGKLLNKALDNRHEATIRRFSKALNTAKVRDLWLDAFEQGGIPGGYWAVLTHPATDRPLVE